MQIPQPKFEIGSKILTTEGLKSEIVGYFFNKNKLYYSINLVKEPKYKLFDITEEEIEKIISLPSKMHQFRWSFGQSMNSVGAVLCGIRHYNGKTWYCIDYPDDPYLRQIYWNEMPKL